MNWFQGLCAKYFKNHPKLVLDSSNWYSGQPEHVRTHFNTSVLRTGVGSIEFDPMILGRPTTDSSSHTTSHTIAYEVQNEVQNEMNEQKYTKKPQKRKRSETKKVQNIKHDIKHDSYNTMN